MMLQLRNIHPLEEFDYPFLMDFLKSYKKPRDKISRLLREKDIIRVKKGLYIFGPDYRRSPVCMESLANLIYGPSYISLEYALSFYGLIPERVEHITSITTEKDKVFKTPIGTFTYKHLSLKKYSVGIVLHQVDPHHTCLIASKEKALVDMITQNRYKDIKTENDLLELLTQDLRIEEAQLYKLNKKHLKAITAIYNHRTAHLLDTLVNK